MEAILISACLLGENCKYNGKNNYSSLVEELKKKYILIPICPESDGGLTTPRDPSERILDKVVSDKGKDVTKEYQKGAELALAKAIGMNVKIAILKDGSPSCGSTYSYDGTFTHTKTSRMGVTAEALSSYGIKIYTENTMNELV